MNAHSGAEVHRLTRTQARRIAVRAQLLDRPRPADLRDVVRRLTLLQIDPTAAVAPNADLVLWSRLGSSYSPEDLASELESGRLVELQNTVRPTEDIDLYRADMAAWPGPAEPRTWRHAVADWVDANDICRRDIMMRLEVDGPLPSNEIPDTCEVPWKSSGWNNGRNVTQMLEAMASSGRVAVAGRSGRERLWDLAFRVYPDNVEIGVDEARSRRNERRLAALGIARSRIYGHGEPPDVGDAGEPAVIDGVKGTWRVEPSLLGGSFAGRAALLSPLDRLVFDRKRMVDLFEFDYQLEMYKPATKRRWGYFALPVLYGDSLVGKLDATADRKAGVLRVNALHADVPFTATTTKAIDREIADLARWLRLDLDRRDL